MGVVSACALSFMSKYLHQSCDPKPMTRVGINDNNQSSNNNHELDIFQEHFTKIFGKNKDYHSLYDQFYNYKINSG
jgi:hypothetical protein